MCERRVQGESEKGTKRTTVVTGNKAQFRRTVCGNFQRAKKDRNCRKTPSLEKTSPKAAGPAYSVGGGTTLGTFIDKHASGHTAIDTSLMTSKLHEIHFQFGENLHVAVGISKNIFGRKSTG